jgi:hypothetical protein
VSNNAATGNAQTPGNQASQNGQNNVAPDDGAPVQLSPDDIAAQAAADAADGGAPPGGDTDGEGNRVPQARFSEVVAERNASMEYANYWRNEALRMMQGGAPPQGGTPPPAAQAADDDPEPTLEQHGHDIAKFTPAHSAWVRREIQRGVSTGVSQAMTGMQQQQAEQQTQQSYATRAAEFAASKPDFGIVTGNPALPITRAMTSLIMSSPVGPAIAYHLGTNPAEAARISRLQPVQQAAAMGKLEAKFEKPEAPAGRAPGAGGNGAASGGNGGAAPQRSRAPDPPNPTRTGGQPDINMRTCSLNEYLEQRLPQISKMQGKSGGSSR